MPIYYLFRLLICCILLGVLTSCQAPVWMYVRNLSNSTLVVEMELLSGSEFAHLPTKAPKETLLLSPKVLQLAYKDKVLPIKRRTDRQLTQKIEAEVINTHHLRFYLPAHSTLYLAEPYEAVSYEELRIRYAKIKQETPVYQYQNIPIYAFKRGGGSIFLGFGIYYDIE